MSIEDRVKKIVSDQLGTSLDEIQSDSSFVDDLGAVIRYSLSSYGS